MAKTTGTGNLGSASARGVTRISGGVRGAARSVDALVASLDRVASKLNRIGNVRPMAGVAKSIQADMTVSERSVAATMAKIQHTLTSSNSYRNTIAKGIVSGLAGAIGRSLWTAIFSGPGGPGAMGGGGAFQIPGLKLLVPIAAFEGLRRSTKAVASEARGTQTGFLDGILRSIDVFDRLVKQVGVRFLVALAPAFTRFVELAVDGFRRFGPLIDKVSAGFSALFYAGVELFGALVDGIGDALDSMGPWAVENFNAATSSEDFGKTVLLVIRKIGAGIAYLWDLSKGFIGWMVSGIGQLIEALGDLVSALGEVFKGNERLGKVAMYATTSPLLWKNISDMPSGEAMEKRATALHKIGAGLRTVGDFASNSGPAVDQFNKYMDGVEARYDATRAKLAKNVLLEQPKLAPAMERGSKEAYSVIARFQAGNMIAASAEKEQLRATQETNRRLTEVKQAIQELGFNPL